MCACVCMCVCMCVHVCTSLSLARSLCACVPRLVHLFRSLVANKGFAILNEFDCNCMQLVKIVGRGGDLVRLEP
jgi:hypothetical protein